MSEIIETVTEYETKALDAITQLQADVLEYLKKVVAAVEERLPEIPELPEQLSFIEKLPTMQEIVDTQFAFSKKLLANNEKFAKNVVKAVKPLSRESLIKTAGTEKAAA